MTEQNHTIWTLVLAAGSSKRFGAAKVLATWGEGTLLTRVLDTAKAVTGSQVMIVVGGHADLLEGHLSLVHSVYNPLWDEGLGTSVAVGTRAILEKAPDTNAIVLLLADQPLVTPAHIEKLLASTILDSRCAFSTDGVTTGPPAVIPRRFFDLLWTLTGEEGLKSKLSLEDMTKILVADQMRDVDTQADLEDLKAVFSV